MGDDLGDRMKLYEQVEAGRRLMPLLPAMARIDGRCFSSFTRGMERPYDVRLSRVMIETTRRLVEETNACAGFTQSDEISLAWLATTFDSQIFFDGKMALLRKPTALSSCCETLSAVAKPSLPQYLTGCPKTTPPKALILRRIAWAVKRLVAYGYQKPLPSVE